MWIFWRKLKINSPRTFSSSGVLSPASIVHASKHDKSLTPLAKKSFSSYTPFYLFRITMTKNILPTIISSVFFRFLTVLFKSKMIVKITIKNRIWCFNFWIFHNHYNCHRHQIYCIKMGNEIKCFIGIKILLSWLFTFLYVFTDL